MASEDELEIARLRVVIMFLLDIVGNGHCSYTMREIIDRINALMGESEITDKWIKTRGIDNG